MSEPRRPLLAIVYGGWLGLGDVPVGVCGIAV